MLQSRNRKPHPLANTTPFPNGLFEWMPELKDSEWRLICLIVRGTWGWRDSTGERKQSDWLTQKQMMKRTGRSSEALSRAVDNLVRRGLIEVRDANSLLLTTPADRRRAGGRLYFSVLPRPWNSESKTRSSKSEVVTTKAHEPGVGQKKTQSNIGTINGRSEVGGARSEVSKTESGVRKTNTTKEKQTKLEQKTTESCPSAKGAKPDLMIEEANERRVQTRSHTGWFHAGSRPPHKHHKEPRNPDLLSS